MRGNRFHGKGDTKNKRGAGTKGGKGRAGSHKHKFSKYYMTFGQKITLKGKPKEETINLDDLNLLLEKAVSSKENKFKTEQGKIVVDGKDFDYGKILSRGELVHKVVFRNIGVSKKALDKIQASGSVVEGV